MSRALWKDSIKVDGSVAAVVGAIVFEIGDRPYVCVTSAQAISSEDGTLEAISSISMKGPSWINLHQSTTINRACKAIFERLKIILNEPRVKQLGKLTYRCLHCLFKVSSPYQ